MRTTFLLLIYSSLLSTWVFGQGKIEWSFDYAPFPNSIQVHAKIESGWHLYALDLDPSIGPVPTQIVLEKNKLVKEIAPFTASVPAQKTFDPIFGAELSYHENNFEAKNRIVVKKPTTVKGELTYMLCDDKRCLPPQTIPFEIKVTPQKFEKPN